MKKELKLTTVFVAAITLLIIGQMDYAEAAAYIKFDGIDGEAKDTAHQTWSDLLSFSHSIHKSSSSATDAQRTRGETTLGDVVIVREIDKASPKLQESVLKGMIFPMVQFEFASSSDGATYLKYELKNVMITSISTTGTADDRPTEEIALNFEEIKVTYTEYDSATKKKKGNVEYSWKVEEGES